MNKTILKVGALHPQDGSKPIHEPMWNELENDSVFGSVDEGRNPGIFKLLVFSPASSVLFDNKHKPIEAAVRNRNRLDARTLKGLKPHWVL